jgi:hypothetical protein
LWYTVPEEEKWEWEFLGFESDSEGCPVQLWFDALPDEAKEEIEALVKYLRVKTHSRWQKPSFDPLKGSCGISEIRPDNVSVEVDGKLEEITYRIYGFFGPGPHVYTFLHGNRKEVTNDREGKRIACRRLEAVKRERATVHVFRFNNRYDPAINEESSHENQVC